MKKIWSRILVIFMVMVTIFQVAVPPELCFVDSVVYAEDKVSWWDKFKKAAGEIALNGLNLLIHQIPGSDAIMEAVRTALKGTEWEGVVEYLTMKEYIPDHTAWYRPLITSAADANGVTEFINSAYNHLTDDTGEKSDLFIYYYNSSGEQAYPKHTVL